MRETTVSNADGSCPTESVLNASYAPVAAAAECTAESNGRSIVLYNGTNADDLMDVTRLGLLAASTYQVTVYTDLFQILSDFGSPQAWLRSAMAYCDASLASWYERHFRPEIEIAFELFS